MAVTRVLPLGSYPDQTRALGPVALPTGASSISLSLLRCTPSNLTIWPNASTTVALNADLSLDGGTTWQPWFTFTSQGGQVTPEGGSTVAPTTYFTTSIPAPANANRKVRATLTITGGPLKTAGDLTVS